jgi:hypothetical protein
VARTVEKFVEEEKKEVKTKSQKGKSPAKAKGKK